MQQDRTIDPGEAHEVLVDVTGGNETMPPDPGEASNPSDSPADADRRDGDMTAANGETVPKEPDDVSDSKETAERLQGHGSEPSPPADVPASQT